MSVSKFNQTVEAGMADGEKREATLVTTMDQLLVRVLDEIPQADVSKLLPSFPGNRWPLVACLIFAQEIGAAYSKYIPVVVLFRARNHEESLLTVGPLQSIRWTLGELQPWFLEEKDRCRISLKETDHDKIALLVEGVGTPHLECNTTEQQDLHS